MWGDKSLMVRVSVVDRDVPFLISRAVLQRMQAVIDLGSHRLTTPLIPDVGLALIDLPSGHVAITLVAESQASQFSAGTARESCAAGAEVAAADPDLSRCMGGPLT